MKDKSIRFWELEVTKLLQEKLFVVFLLLCLCMNIGLCFTDNYVRKMVHQFSTEEFSQSGEKIYDHLNGATLGTAYYNQRYLHSSKLNQKMKEKYERLQIVIDCLNEQQADLDFYAGEVTPVVHKALFEYQLKALLIESVMFLSLLCLRTFSLERQNETRAIIYSSRRGRKIAKDKIFANGIVGGVYCIALFVTSLAIFFSQWDFSKIWKMNVSSSFNYINDANDPIYMKPFLTWESMTVKDYFISSLLLIGILLIAWWLIANIFALLIRRDLLGGIGIVAVLVLPYFGLMLFPGLNMTIPFYLSTLTLSTVIYDSHMWFTDLGHYSLIAYQEVRIVTIHLMAAVLVIGFAYRYFRRRELM